MKQLLSGIRFAAIAGLAAGGCGKDPTSSVDPAEGTGVVGESVRSNYRIRTYSLIKPATYDGTVPAPLLILFHGAGDTGAQFRLRTGLYGSADTAGRAGFILVYPDGVNGSWAVGCNCTDADGLGIDDVRFVRTLLAQLSAGLAIDASRIYVAGYSEGAMLAHRLACELSDRLAGAASVAATMVQRVADRCGPQGAVPFVFFHGTADLLFPWDGGGGWLSVPATIGKWTALDGCTGPPVLGMEPDRENDGTLVRTERYAACRAGAEVMLYAVEGGGHTWPGALGSFPAFAGVLSRDISANEILVGFFARHARTAIQGSRGTSGPRHLFR